MKKDQIEKAFRAGGAAPVLREKMGPYDLFMADSGLSHPPHFRFQRFGIEPGDFPRGMFATIWWLGMDEKLLIGRPMFFEPTELDRKSVV